MLHNEDGFTLKVRWGARSEINWRRQTDFTRSEQRARRRKIAKTLIEKFGTFKDD